MPLGMALMLYRLLVYSIYGLSFQLWRGAEESYWASEASPTLGCSIEISRDICRYVCRVLKCVGRITCTHAQSQFWAVKTDL